VNRKKGHSGGGRNPGGDEMKLDDVQKFKIQEAYEKANSVLCEVKRRPLSAKDLTQMKTLESAVINLESIMCLTA